MARIREITVHLGVSVDKQGVWVKPALGVTIDNLDTAAEDPERRKEVISRAFEIVKEAIDEELDKLLEEE